MLRIADPRMRMAITGTNTVLYGWKFIMRRDYAAIPRDRL